jgi:ABC-type uncharacterized transport system involved in gliding motility auxiliary subunit
MRNLLSSTGLIIGLVLFAVLNLFAESTLRAGRIDLTENRLFTLSEGTLKILSNLDQKLTLRFYFSEELATEYPGLSDYGRRVREMLEEYQAHAGDDLELLVFEPEAFSEEEDEALAFGLSAPPVNQAGDKLFFGLVGTNSVDDIERIPFFDPQREEFLEYDLSELVSNLSRFEKKIVGVLSSLPIQGGMSMPGQPPRPAWFVMDQLERSFETRTLDPASTTEIRSRRSATRTCRCWRPPWRTSRSAHPWRRPHFRAAEGERCGRGQAHVCGGAHRARRGRPPGPW